MFTLICENLVRTHLNPKLNIIPKRFFFCHFVQANKRIKDKQWMKAFARAVCL